MFLKRISAKVFSKASSSSSITNNNVNPSRHPNIPFVILDQLKSVSSAQMFTEIENNEFKLNILLAIAWFVGETKQEKYWRKPEEYAESEEIKAAKDLLLECNSKEFVDFGKLSDEVSFLRVLQKHHVFAWIFIIRALIQTTEIIPSNVQQSLMGLCEANLVGSEEPAEQGTNNKNKSNSLENKNEMLMFVLDKLPKLKHYPL